MFKYSMQIVCCVILCCAEIYVAHEIPKYNFSMFSLYNNVGHWYGEKIQLDHEGGNLWNMVVNYSSHGIRNSQSIFISSISQMNSYQEESQCPPGAGYKLVEGLGHYKIHSHENSWYEAMKTCEQEGAHLYIFNSKMEVDAIDALITKTTGTRVYWIGVHDQFKEGHYVTIFSQPIEHPEYISWWANERANEYCGCIEYGGIKFGFGDYNCTYKHPFICEKELDVKF